MAALGSWTLGTGAGQLVSVPWSRGADEARLSAIVKWLPWIWQKEEGETDEALRNVQRRFGSFLSLLDANNRVLKLFSDLEEKAQGEFLFEHAA